MLKMLVLLLPAILPGLCGPVFWAHTNILVSLPEPAISTIDLTPLDLLKLCRESPQYQVWYEGGMAGYFANEWRAPVWTTPLTDWPQKYEERELIVALPASVQEPPTEVTALEANIPEPSTLGSVVLGMVTVFGPVVFRLTGVRRLARVALRKISHNWGLG